MTEATQKTDTKTLGLARWVQVAYLVAFLTLLWLFDKLVVLGWGYFGDPSPMLSSVGAAALSGVIVWRLYRDERVHDWSHEVVGELAKVTWPSRRETSASTIVVIIASIVAAIIMGAFDAAWSAITDLIYEA